MNAIAEHEIPVIEVESGYDTPEPLFDLGDEHADDDSQNVDTCMLAIPPDAEGGNSSAAVPDAAQRESPENRVLMLHRMNIKADMINAFKDPRITNCHLTIVMIDGRGNEEKGTGIGVVRDAFSLFWKEVYDSLFIGENERVPFIRHDYSRSDWEAIARVIVVGYQICQYLPIRISKAFLSYVLFGECAITSENLIEAFQQYISVEERNTLEKCLAGSFDFDDEEDYDNLLEILGNFDCRTRVNKENVRSVIREIAHKEIIQKTQFITDCWRPTLQYIVTSFPTCEALIEKYEEIQPSVTKVCNSIESSPQCDAERDCLKFLKKFIKGLDTSSKLATFLRFISGSELMLFAAIHVTFNELSGFARRPIARTCNTLLELSSTYQSYPEFREEFNHILLSDNWEVDMV